MDNRIVIGLVAFLILFLVFGQKSPKSGNGGKIRASETVIELSPGNLAVLKYGSGCSLGGVQLKLVNSKGDDLTSQMGLDGIPGTVTLALSFDLNRDGYSDLILGGPQMGLWIYENRIHGQFRSGGFIGIQVLSGNGIAINRVLIHDFNRDGNADLMVYYADGSKKVLKNVGGAGMGGSFLSYVEKSGPEMEEMAKDMLKIVGSGLPWLDVVKDNSPYKFIVKLPNNIEFANSKVMIRVGQGHLVKYNLAGMGRNGLVVFGSREKFPIDGVKIRTIYGKEHSYGPQPLGSILVVDPIVKFDSQENIYRSQSMG